MSNATAKTVRRIVTIDDEEGKSVAIADSPSPDVRTDHARPGYSSARIWVTDRTPARIARIQGVRETDRTPARIARIQGVRETLDMPHTMEPPPRGSVCRVVTFPPDKDFRDRVTARDVEAFFRSMGSPGASTYTPDAPHPYMQKTNTLDFCLVLEGEITLVLDMGEVALRAGDTVVQRGTNHAWSNRSDRPCVVAFSSHDGRW
ncbi:MAG: cupin domain-containing protein [Betaproteobacteria bacterium]|nr:cupin domain-containing protein [Betaproteobacteria bacterium]